MQYIAVEGCIGIGKTTVVTQLNEIFESSDILLEDFEKNHFLADFYCDSTYAYETEIEFLLIHYHQLLKATRKNSDLLLGDFYIGKDNLFAEMNLDNSDELRIFKELYGQLSKKIMPPDLVICLSAATDLIFNRINNRKRSVENGVSYEYIEKINRSYEPFFVDVRKSFITIDIDMNTWDFVKDTTLKYKLKDRIQSTGMLTCLSS